MRVNHLRLFQPSVKPAGKVKVAKAVFALGDCVTLKTGGMPMTVTGVSSTGGVQVSFWAGGEFYEREYHPDALVHSFRTIFD